jgi:phenylacetate-CoA ligase
MSINLGSNMGVFIRMFWPIVKPGIYRSYVKQKEIRKLSLFEIQKIQWNRLKELLEFAYNSSVFYHDTFKAVGLKPEDIKSYEDFQLLPIVNKKILKNNYKSIITTGTRKKDYTIARSGGTTGEPFSFLVDNNREYPSTNAAFLLNKESIGISPYDKTNELLIKAKPTHEIKNLHGVIERGIPHRIKYYFLSEIFGVKSLDIKQENLEIIKSLVKDNHIEVICGYSSNIFYLAKLCKMHDIDLNIHYVIPIAEGLSKQQRDFISNTFHSRLYMDYGASECMRMGFECNQHTGYHMDLYNYYFEYLNDHGEVCKPGENANIIVTNLNNHVFPLVRYRIGDQCVVSEKTCSCGNNYLLVSQITGRESDVIRISPDSEISLLTFRSFFGTLDQYIIQYQLIVDEKAKEIIIKIVPTQNTRPDVFEGVTEKLLEITNHSMNITIEFVEEIPFDKNGKTKPLIIKS